MPSSAYRLHTHCRVCGTVLGEAYLDLGEQPLANALEPPDFDGEGPTAPLEIILCQTCGLSQLSVVVDPHVLYSRYRFRSGASESWKEHCEELARACAEKFKKPGFVIDIAANDGTQLKPFSDRGWTAVGVEPADIPFIFRTRVERRYWSMDVAKMLRHEHRAADLVIAQNVLGHVDEPVAFLRAIEHVLAPDGLAVIEVPHAREMILSCAFDTIYHEHLSYWNAGGIIRAAHQAGLILDRLENLYSIHGGSRRYWLKKPTEGAPVRAVLTDIAIDLHPYHLFANNVERQLQHIKRVLREMAQADLVIGAYGAAAKGTVMLNALGNRGNTVWPCAIVDDVPEKQGLLSPGLHIPIVSPEASGMIEWDICWILSWNNAESIREKCRALGFKGEFFVTHPRVKRGE